MLEVFLVQELRVLLFGLMGVSSIVMFWDCSVQYFAVLGFSVL